MCRRDCDPLQIAADGPMSRMTLGLALVGIAIGKPNRSDKINLRRAGSMPTNLPSLMHLIPRFRTGLMDSRHDKNPSQDERLDIWGKGQCGGGKRSRGVWRKQVGVIHTDKRGRHINMAPHCWQIWIDYYGVSRLENTPRKGQFFDSENDGGSAQSQTTSPQE